MPMMYDQWLNRYRDISADLIDLKREVQLARDRLESITQGYSDMPGGGDNVESRRNAEAKLGDISRRYDEQQKRCCEVREEIRQFIYAIPGSDHKTRDCRIVLEYYYCVGLNVTGDGGIADKMQYTSRAVYYKLERGKTLARRLYDKWRSQGVIRG